MFGSAFAGSCEYSNSRWCGIQPIAIRDVITSSPSLLFITVGLFVGSSCQGGRWTGTPAHSSSSEKCTVLAQIWIHSRVTLDYELECDWGCSSIFFFTLVLGLLSCCRAADRCNTSTAGVRLTSCSTLSRCLRGGVAQHLTWGLGIIASFFLYSLYKWSFIFFYKGNRFFLGSTSKIFQLVL